MQVYFTMDEMKLLVDIIEGCDRRLRDEMNEHPEQATIAKKKRDCCARLLDRMVARDFAFGFDELEDMAEMLTSCRASLCGEISRTDNPQVRAELQERQKRLEHILDKVTEACAMA
jgi:hypothetical protein